MTLANRPWMVSERHPQTGMYIITNPQGHIIAMVQAKEDAEFICKAREAYPVKTVIQVDWKTFGRAVQSARKERRFSQDIAAEMCGISRNYMSMIERGTATDPSYTIVLTLCRWLRLEMPQ